MPLNMPMPQVKVIGPGFLGVNSIVVVPVSGNVLFTPRAGIVNIDVQEKLLFVATVSVTGWPTLTLTLLGEYPRLVASMVMF